MKKPANLPSPEELLQHVGWMRGLAQSLVKDPARAEDLVQESLLTCLEKPPVDSLALGTWLRRVLCRFAGRRRREERNRERRERSVARPERIHGSPAEVLERAELQRALMDMVLGLDEPYRSTILCRFFEGMSPVEIARRDGIPVTTVRSRIATALERLRFRLGRTREEGRRSWCVGLALLAEVDVAALSPAKPAMASRDLVLGGLSVTAKKIGGALAASALIFLGLGALLYFSGIQGQRGHDLSSEAARPEGSGPAPSFQGEPERTPAGPETVDAVAIGSATVPVDEGPPSIVGRVTDFEGQGIAGAKVAAIDAAAWDGLLVGVEERYPEPFTAALAIRAEIGGIFRAAPSTITGEDGSYSFRGLAEAEFGLIAIHPRYLPGSDSRALVVSGVTARCDIELAAGNAIGGRVEDENGAPVGGAVVSAMSSQAAATRGMGKMMQAVQDLAAGAAMSLGAEVRSASDGTFLIGGLEPVLQDLTARKPGLLPARARKVPPGAGDLALVLVRGASVAGRILDPSGTPIEGAGVGLAEPRPDSSAGGARSVAPRIMVLAADFDLLAEKSRVGASRGDGRFSLEGVEEGGYELRIEARGFTSLVTKCFVEKASIDLGDIALERAFSISGMVLGPAGQPAGDAAIRATLISEGSDGTRLRSQAALAFDGKSGARGDFVIDGLPAGSYRLAAVSADFADGGLDLVAAGARGVTIPMGEVRDMSGVCLDAADRSPISGATVRIVGSPRPPVTTSENGEFTLPCPLSTLEAAGSVRLRAAHADYDVVSSPVPAEAPAPIEILLRRAPGVRGVVRDRDGNPVARARIQVEVPGVPQVILGIHSKFEDVIMPHYSGTDGSFFVRTPRGGGLGSELPMDVVAFHPVHGRARASQLAAPRGADLPEVELVLSPGLPLEGRVVDRSGAAIPGAQVRALRHASAVLPARVAMLQALLPSPGGKLGYSNKDGVFRIPALEPGPYRLEAIALGYARKSLGPVDVREAAPRIDIALDPGASISGRVLDPGGSSVAGAEVLAFLSSQTSREEKELETVAATGLAQARSDARGRFEMKNLPGAVFSIVARAPGFEPARIDGIEPGPPDDEEAPVELVLVPLSALRGTVTDAGTGAAVARFQVRLDRLRDDAVEDEVERRSERTFADPDGAFRIEDLAGGEYWVHVESEEYTTLHERIRLEPDREASIEARLGRSLRIEGTVRALETRETVPGALVVLRRRDTASADAGPSREEHRITGNDARFLFRDLAAGDYDLLVLHPGFYMDGDGGTLRVTVSAEGEPARLEVDMRPAGHIRGRVKKRGQVDPASLEVVASRVAEDGNENARLRSGMAPVEPSWDYRIGGLAPGKYRLEVRERRGAGEAEPASAGVAHGIVEIGAGEVKTVDVEAP